ncbi:cyclic nucleotide-binding domain-containing protein [Niveispirillum irakense]|uniref:cyclic nucleotide-binding domain-containing protein n=1 Tax=Niveispirillum irakense TaxID=34011 RepID=UPI0004049EBC|nr:cyclic nucleotide-binding domain-containing protein [Niveispirillum irakense]
MGASLTTEIEALRRLSIFSGIELSKLKILAFTSERASFTGGAILFRQDEVSDAAYVILDGTVEVQVETPNGQRHVALVGDNGIVGEIGILCDVPRTATVQAVGPVTTLRISKDQFFRLVGEFPQIAVAVMRELALRLEKTTRDLTLKS